MVFPEPTSPLKEPVHDPAGAHIPGYDLYCLSLGSGKLKGQVSRHAQGASCPVSGDTPRPALKTAAYASSEA